MTVGRFLVFTLFCIALAPPDPGAAEEPWFGQETATGNWGGLRDRTVEAGVTPEANYTTNIFGNPVGGEKQGMAYAGMFEASLEFDLAKIADLDGLSFFAAAAWTSGRDLSADKIGNEFTVAQVFNGRTVRLSQLYVQQTFFGDGLNIQVGRLSTGDDFAVSPLFAYYINDGVDSVPASIPINVPSFTVDPFAAWGARIIATPADWLYVAAGAYNADTTVQDDGAHGVDFRLNLEDGLLAVAEVGVRLNQNDGQTGLPGNYRIGGYFDSSEFDTLNNPDVTKSGNYGFYVLVDQMAYREHGSDGQGLTPWIALTVAPDDDINTFPLFASGGLVYRGLFPGRDQDATAFALYHGKFSDRLRGQSHETVLEINHRFQFAPWFYVTPTFQYIFRPDGTGQIADAAVFGGEIGIDF